jgi:hypothetical protein
MALYFVLLPLDVVSSVHLPSKQPGWTGYDLVSYCRSLDQKEPFENPREHGNLLKLTHNRIHFTRMFRMVLSHNARSPVPFAL